MFMRYEVVAFRYIWSNRTLGGASFQNDIAPGKIVSVYVVGTLLVGLCTMLVGLALIAVIVAGGVFLQGVNPMDQLAQLQAGLTDVTTGAGVAELMQFLPALVVAAAFIYLILFAVPFAFAHIFIIRPILRRKVEAMVINEAQALAHSRQREHDHAAEAGGSADALGVDVGAGF
jgi:hypothetical protein